MGPRNRAGRVVGAGAVAVLLLTLSSCSDDDHDDQALLTPTPVPSTSRPTAPDDPSAAERSIRANWTKFFDPRTPAHQRQALLENGKLLAGVLQTYDAGAQGGASVQKIEFASAVRAEVTYTLSGSPKAVTGTSVEQGGTWKVSAGTVCALPRPTSGAKASGAPVC
ncbi:hypothetical protein IAG44_31650 [Streptomyces roseirectus]|uniref:Low molecular weight antigen MTB12-like C-terminal domain-containing protein n=1 Tax=Streptomyces roseirectus TaxID=2768066 RepID=A0A7H0IL93_9ACTN|nr:hypothetical protein [Streptomyces roseirectus]QNP73559.1 hypothetical protein IAG44_31650 [Streptomyces roseirectus]